MRKQVIPFEIEIIYNAYMKAHGCQPMRADVIEGLDTLHPEGWFVVMSMPGDNGNIVSRRVDREHFV